MSFWKGRRHLVLILYSLMDLVLASIAEMAKNVLALGRSRRLDAELSFQEASICRNNAGRLLCRRR